jgi:anti-anti-sigma factor
MASSIARERCLIEVIMHGRTRIVEVIQIPETLDGPHQMEFSREFETCINLDRPAIVLDCSKVRQMDGSAIRVLLCCLEEAMKRNGDVRLAMVNPDAVVWLKSYGLDRVFELFSTINDALESFCWPGSIVRSYPDTDEAEKQVSDTAA